MGEDVEPTFEKALAELEGIVAALERGEPELTSALAKHERGVKLLSICHRILEKAEQSVAILTGVDEDGNALTTMFDASATMTTVSETKSTPADPAEPAAGALDRKRKTSERTVVRRGRTAPENPTADPDDPPF